MSKTTVTIISSPAVEIEKLKKDIETMADANKKLKEKYRIAARACLENCTTIERMNEERCEYIDTIEHFGAHCCAECKGLVREG